MEVVLLENIKNLNIFSSFDVLSINLTYYSNLIILVLFEN